MRIPIAVTDAKARIYFFTGTYLSASGSAKGRAYGTVVFPLATTPSMLLKNKPTFQPNHRRVVMPQKV
jgi:hypothetical protein